MQIEYSITVEDMALEALKDAIARSPQTMRKFVYKTVRNHLMNTTIKELRTPAPPPQYPLTWRSPAQRRATIAKLRKENNLPYQRTGELERGWKVEVDSNAQDTLLSISNDVPYVNQVMGVYPERQPMFPQWGVYPLIILEGQEWAQNAIIEEWFSIVEPQKGVKSP